MARRPALSAAALLCTVAGSVALAQSPVRLSAFGSDGMSPRAQGLAALGQRLIFSTGEFGDLGRVGLWRSDGSPLTTVRIAPGIVVRTGFADPSDSDPRPGPVVAGNLAFFVGADVSQGPAGPVGLYRTDGTPEGTILLRQFVDSTMINVPPRQLTALGSTLFFAVRSALWKSDGTVDGTSLVLDLGEASFASPQGLTSVNGTMLFFSGDAFDPAIRGLYRSNGTPAGTTRIVPDLSIDLGSGPTPGEGGRRPAVAGGRMFFSGRTGGIPGGGSLWTSDGTPGGTFEVASFQSGGVPVSPRGFTAVGAPDATVYFLVGSALWRTIGSPPLAALVRDLGSGPDFASITAIAGLGPSAIFSVVGSTTGDLPGLWRSQGSAQSTARFAPGVYLDTSSNDPGSPAPKTPVEVDGRLYFTGSTDPAGAGTSRALWRTDGTLVGTVEVARFQDPLFPGGQVPDGYVAAGRRLYFRAGADVYLFNTQECRSDFNGDGNIDPDDLADFIALYFSPCP